MTEPPQALPAVVRPLISAHRGGPAGNDSLENTLDALLDAGTVGCEYVEVDVQRCRDGVHVVYHHDDVHDAAGRALPVASLTFAEFAHHAGAFLLLDDALQVFHDGPKVHLDVKFLSDPSRPAGAEELAHEVALVAHVVDVLGPENVLVTTLDDESVRAVRGWSRDRHPDLLIGLSLGRDLPLRRPWDALRILLGDLFPAGRIRRCGANLVVAHKGLARLHVARWAARAGLPLLVWTVDRPRELRRWLRDPRVWLVTTNYPRRAMALRASR